MVRGKNIFSFFFLLVVVFMISIFTFVPVRAAEEIVLTSETVFYAETIRTLKPENLNEGDEIQLVVSEDVIIEDEVVIRKGTPVLSVVTEVQTRGFFRKNDKITLEVKRVKAVDGTTVSLGGSRTFSGEGRQSDFWDHLLFFMGKEAVFPAHSRIKTKAENDYLINLK